MLLPDGDCNLQCEGCELENKPEACILLLLGDVVEVLKASKKEKITELTEVKNE